jgi:hypothetical protein
LAAEIVADDRKAGNRTRDFDYHRIRMNEGPATQAPRFEATWPEPRVRALAGALAAALPAALLLGAFAGSCVFAALAALGIALASRDRAFRASREDKLMAFAVLFFLAVTLLGDLTGTVSITARHALERYAPFLLFLPAFLAVRRVPRADLAWWAGLGGAFAAAALMLVGDPDVTAKWSGLAAWPDAMPLRAAWRTFLDHPLIGEGAGDHLAAGEYLAVAASRGLLGLLALGLLLGIPLAQFTWGAGHPDATIRRISYAASSLIAAYLALALAYPVLEQPPGAGLHAALLAVAWGALRAREAAWLATPKARRETVSVALIVRDEADRIGRCLDAVAGWADEIVVLDSGSTDATVEIARRYTRKVEVTDWPGYGVQKQRAASRCTSDWILSIDADELVGAELRSEIDGELNGACRHDAFRFPWSVEIFGERVDFGADGRKHVRLFRRAGPARFDAAVVHEGLVDVANLRSLHGAVMHETFRDYAHLLDKFARYAVLQAGARHRRGKRASVAGALLRSLFNFLSLYFYRLGMLDGRRGLLMAILYAHYTFNKYGALWALGATPRGDGGDQPTSV